MLAATATPTTTTLAVLPSTSIVTGNAIKLTAHVSANNAAVTAGSVVFCNASAAYCEDGAVLGTAQLTVSGNASLTIVPSPGSHIVNAIY